MAGVGLAVTSGAAGVPAALLGPPATSSMSMCSGGRIGVRALDSAAPATSWASRANAVAPAPGGFRVPGVAGLPSRPGMR